jgi:hypothetical protein
MRKKKKVIKSPLKYYIKKYRVAHIHTHKIVEERITKGDERERKLESARGSAMCCG